MAAVTLGGFLGRRVDGNVQSLLAGFDSPVCLGFEADAIGDGRQGDYRRRGAADTDLYKWLEAACYALACGHRELGAPIDHVAETIIATQAPAGFIHTHRSREDGLDPKARNELYLAGHLFEAAVAHHRATGEDALLDAARRWADYLHEHLAAGHAYFEEVPASEHPEVELALVRLARATGEQRYLDFAADVAARATVTGRVADLRCGPHDRHAVCACYTLSAWAELFLETGDERWLAPLEPLLDEMVTTRLYLHGGIGLDEIIPTNPWHLPQSGSVAETCASVGLMKLARRMHAITGQSCWFDLIERTLYNALLGALSADQLGIFYFSPLRLLHRGDEGRQDLLGRRTRLPDLHRTSCCFPNAWRMLAALPEWAFASRPLRKQSASRSDGDDALQVNLYTHARCRVEIGGVPVRLRVRTEYPAAGLVEVEVTPEAPVRFRLELRVPGWCEGAVVSVAGGQRLAAVPGTYHAIDRTWEGSTVVHLVLPMHATAVASHPEIVSNIGQVAFTRGPLLYCLEEQDARGLEIARIAVPEGCLEELGEGALMDTRDCLPVLRVPAVELAEPAGNEPYPRWQAAELARADVVTLVPWLARANRTSRRWTALLRVLEG